MKAMWKACIGVSLLAMVFCSSWEGTASARAAKVEKVLYSRYNIHYFAKKDVNTASYANYTDCPGHSFLPYGTKLKVESLSSYGFRLVAIDTGMKIRFEYKAKRMDGMSSKDYIDLITSPTPVSYSNLTAQDEQGIKAGKALVGMTKQGVMVALGYPEKEKTPSTERNTWYYWSDRFAYYLVSFDDSGKVTSIQR